MEMKLTIKRYEEVTLNVEVPDDGDLTDVIGAFSDVGYYDSAFPGDVWQDKLVLDGRTIATIKDDGEVVVHVRRLRR